jgi:hypothetical protein
MAIDKKISQLTLLTSVDESNDYLPIVKNSTTVTSRIKPSVLMASKEPVLVSVIDSFTPTLGQTVFTLSQTRKSNTLFTLELNGIVQIEGTHFTVSAKTLTWANYEYLTLVTTDKLIARYYY